MEGKRFNAYTGPGKASRPWQKLVLDAGFSCPNRDGTKGSGGCTFCDNAAFHPAYSSPSKSITSQLDEGIAFHAARGRKADGYLAYFQSFSNTYASLDTLRSRFGEALSHPAVKGLVIGTRPDCVDGEKLDFLAELAAGGHPVIVEYGIESCYDETLRRVNRGHDFETACRAVTETVRRGLSTGAHFILGLPGESVDMMLSAAEKINGLSLDHVKFHQLQILRGTPMEAEFDRDPDAFVRWTPETYVDFLVDLLERLRPDLAVERIASSVPPRFHAHPGWGLPSAVLQQRLEKRLEERDSWQGSKFFRNFAAP